MKIELPSFTDKQAMLKWLVTNKDLLIAQKKSEVKQADAVIYSPTVMQKLKPITAAKDGNPVITDISEIQVLSAINSTNWLDSHDDVHIPGLWNKCLAEKKSFYLVQEHKMQFEKIISDMVTASVKTFSFKELGFDVSGDTEVLLFDSTVTNDRNPFMFNQYMKGWVKNHSVGMQYVKLYLCVNSEDAWAAQEKDNWDKYYPMIANKQEADETNYFWAVTEAKVIEGSAVPIGSNAVTPTVSVSSKAADNGTLNNEPPVGTQPKTEPAAIRWDKIVKAVLS